MDFSKMKINRRTRASYYKLYKEYNKKKSTGRRRNGSGGGSVSESDGDRVTARDCHRQNVKSFNPTNNLWIPGPPLYWKNINVAGASIKDKLFVVGGAKESHYSSEVEYLDLNIGKWLPACSMQSKRLAPAAAELNNVLYVSGGYDGVSYTSYVERFDPREEFWCKVLNMNARKGCHSMVVLNRKLYTVGGFGDGGDRDLATVEYLDTRMGAWVEAEPMNNAIKLTNQ